jgi:bifunctional non-homologous end joining protein LigD
MPPVPMLASSISEWPEGGGWVLEPKYDGYRLMVQTRSGGRVCAWSRHGTSLTEPLRELLAPVAALSDGWVFDGELIALGDHNGRPVQDFAGVGRAVFGRDRAAASRLHYVAFDLLAAGNAGDIQHAPWLRRTALLAEHLPADERLRVMSTLPATSDTHARLVAMGFEGTVLKRQSGSYRPGRTSSWRKLKARHRIAATIAGVHEDRDGRVWARCGLEDGRRCTVWADARARGWVGRPVTVVYSRIDADGSLREPRLLQPPAVTKMVLSPEPATPSG